MRSQYYLKDITYLCVANIILYSFVSKITISIDNVSWGIRKINLDKRKGNQKIAIKFFLKTNEYNLEPNFTRTIVSKLNLEQILIKLSPYSWSTPFGLRKRDYELYWHQPENHRNFQTSKSLFSVSEIYGLVEVHYNARLLNIQACAGNETHYINYPKDTIYSCNSPEYDTVVVLPPCYDTMFFQHFLDNGTPQISLMHLATKFDPAKTVICLMGWDTELIPYLLTRYGFYDIILFDGEISAKKLIIPAVHPFVHPIFTEDFISQIHLDHSMPADLIILVSRTIEDGVKATRQILNQKELEDEMHSVFGDNFVVFHPLKTGHEETIELFQRAAVIVGSHGGGLYHSFWARKGTALVEIMPETPDGRYHGQANYSDGTVISHRCFHTNARCLGQKFFRYVVYSKEENYHINVTDFMEWLEDALNSAIN